VLTTAYAPGKSILFGEHAVVYGRPAIAVPVTQVRACAIVEDAPRGQGISIRATDLGLTHRVGARVAANHPSHALQATVVNTLERLGVDRPLDLTLTVSSTVPMARGLGSGAALATAIVRSLADHLGHDLAPQEVSDLVYQTEIIHHGTPSGIDNTVIAFEQPVYFVRDEPMQLLRVRRPFWLAIGDTGMASLTRIAVGDVRTGWAGNPKKYDALFDGIGAIAAAAKNALSSGRIGALGKLMNENQALLQALGVSSPELNRLVAAARDAGAIGAKLCGAGRGGAMLALATAAKAEGVAAELLRAGAVGVIVTQVGGAVTED